MGKGSHAIFRQLLSLFAILPMLLPSGMCLCQCQGPVAPAATTDVLAATDPLPAPHDGCRSGCCNGTDGPALNFAPTPIARSFESVRHDDRTPSPHKHNPDCPVVTGISPRLAVAPCSALGACLPIADSRLARALPHFKPATAPSDCNIATIAATPLFISHCALLI